MRINAIFKRDQLEAFLLGVCDEPAARDMEELLFADELLLQELAELKAALLDGYAAGTLRPELLGPLIAQAERSPQLQAEMQSAKSRYSPRRRSTRRRFKAYGPFPGWRFAYTMAFAAIVFAFVVVLKLPRRVQPRREEIAEKRASASPAKTARPADATATIFLSATVLRGSLRVPAFQVSPEATEVELQIEVHGPVASGWSMSLFRDGKVAAQQGDLPERAEGEIHYVATTLPVSQLPPGVYRVTLIPSSGEMPDRPAVTKVFSVVPHIHRN